MITRSDYMAALSRVAKSNGVSTDEVEASFKFCIEKARASSRSLFLPYSVITRSRKRPLPGGGPEIVRGERRRGAGGAAKLIGRASA